MDQIESTGGVAGPGRWNRFEYCCVRAAASSYWDEEE